MNQTREATAQLATACAEYISVMAEKGQLAGHPVRGDGLGILCLYIDDEEDLICKGQGSPELWSEMMLGLARQDKNFRLALAVTFSHLVDAHRARADGPD